MPYMHIQEVATASDQVIT